MEPPFGRDTLRTPPSPPHHHRLHQDRLPSTENSQDFGYLQPLQHLASFQSQQTTLCMDGAMAESPNADVDAAGAPDDLLRSLSCSFPRQAQEQQCPALGMHALGSAAMDSNGGLRGVKSCGHLGRTGTRGGVSGEDAPLILK